MIASPSATTYGGRCPRCPPGRSHALPMTPDAVAAAHALREQLEFHGRLDFDRCGGRSPSPSLSLSSLSPSPSSRAATATTTIGASALGTTDNPSSRSSSYSTRPFLPRSQGGGGGPGRMLGVCLCEPGGVVLRAFSGQLPSSDDSDGAGGGGWSCPGWAGPVHALTNDTPEYARYRRLSDALTRRIAALGDPAAAAAGGATGGGAEERRQRAAAAVARLRSRRRAISHALIARVQNSYVSFDLLGRPLGLRQAYLELAALADRGGFNDGEDEAATAPLPVTRLSFVRPRGADGGSSSSGSGESWRGFRAGVGDCCAPKLLHEAARRGLRPVAMAEFWFGAPPNGEGGDDGDGGDGNEGGGEDDAAGTGPREGESKEEAWRRRQRRRVMRRKQGARRRAGLLAADADADATPTREHGRFYGPCSKCAGILGAMLCDAAA